MKTRSIVLFVGLFSLNFINVSWAGNPEASSTTSLRSQIEHFVEEPGDAISRSGEAMVEFMVHADGQIEVFRVRSTDADVKAYVYEQLNQRVVSAENSLYDISYFIELKFDIQ